MRLTEKLDLYYKAQANVLLVGEHGVGKTSVVKQVFESNGLKLGESWFYFSASTLDPWVDFIGIPKEKEENGINFVELIRPKAFADSSKIEALFIDEYNRAPKKIRNAVMELIQFKSINGKRFPNLKVVWAAINPEDEKETYDVEKLDPAQKDRFVVPIVVPYACDIEYFNNKFGEERATIAIDWWNRIPQDIRSKISPRRLDYALEYAAKGIPLEDILPKESNVNALRQALANGPIGKKLKKLYDDQNTKEAKLFLAIENNYDNALKHITNNEDYIKFFTPLFKKENISLLISEDNNRIGDYVIKNCNNEPVFKSVIENILTASTNPSVLKKIRTHFHDVEKTPTNKVNKTEQLNTEDYETHIIKITQHIKNNLKLRQPILRGINADNVNYTLEAFPKHINYNIATNFIEFITTYFENKWESSLGDLDLKLVCNIWNECYNLQSLETCGSPAFWEKCKNLGIANNMKGAIHV